MAPELLICLPVALRRLEILRLVGGDIHHCNIESAKSVDGGWSGHTVVSPNKCIAVTPLLHAVDVLLAFLERDVHVAVDGLQFT
jgi:hypothetical protein